MDGWGSEEGGSVGQTGLKGWVWDARATTKRRLAAAMLRCLLTSDSGSEGERDDRLIEERRGEERKARLETGIKMAVHTETGRHTETLAQLCRRTHRRILYNIYT